jgi:hypothetical protein
MTTEQRVIPLRCRIFGHKWKPAHRKDQDKHGLPIWVYTDDVCQRCYSTEWRMPHARGQ